MYTHIKNRLRKIANSGSYDACTALGIMHLQGTCTDRNLTLAAKWLRKGANGGVILAMYNLWNLTKEKLYSKADIKWLQQAVTNGHPDAVCEISRILIHGKKYEYVILPLSEAAERGFIEAMFLLGQVYCRREWVNYNPAKSLYWHRKAAEGHWATAMTVLGISDVEDTETWLYEAAKLGDDLAIALYAALESKAICNKKYVGKFV